MVEPGNDFDEGHEEESSGPLLPPEDRLWRHPSEMSSAIERPTPEQTMMARRRWLASTPSRAGAGAAGVVGAILATGVVLVGTHVTSWLNTSHPPREKVVARSGMTSAVTTSTIVPPLSDSSVTPLLSSIGTALVAVHAYRDDGMDDGDGVIISSAGYVLAPASLVRGASSVTVLPSDGEELIAAVRGIDPYSGLAVLKVDETGLPFVRFSATNVSSTASFVIAAWRGVGGGTSDVEFTLDTLQQGMPSGQSMAGGPALLERCPSSLGTVPLGTVVVDANGRVDAIVTGREGKTTLAAGGWLTARIASELIRHGRVVHGWLGVKGVAASVDVATPPLTRNHSLLAMERFYQPVEGVRVTQVDPDSAAAKAGLQRGDVIENVDGKPVSTMADLRAELYMKRPSSAVRLEIVRDHEQKRLDATLQRAA